MWSVTPNIFVEDQFSVYPEFRGGNPGFVITPEGIVLLDTPMLPTDAVSWRDEIAKRGEICFIINTHHHLDHTGGNYFFPGRVVSHERCKERFVAPITRVIETRKDGEEVVATLDVVENFRRRVKELNPEGLGLLDRYQLKEPTITFSERLTLQVGDVLLQLLHLPGHTPGDIGIYLPRERVFFAGDTFTNGVQPSLAQCLPLEWVESLKKIEGIHADVIIPGHGKACGKKEVRDFTAFIQQCIDRVRDAVKKGMSKEEATARISLPDSYPALHSGPWQQRMNVLRLYEILSQ